MSDKISFKVGEAKTLILTVKANGSVLDLTDADLLFAVKKRKTDTKYLIRKDTADFDKTNAESGIVSAFIDDADLSLSVGMYVAELKIDFPDGTIDKSIDLAFDIQAAVTHAEPGP
jgi:hypothetical protein